MDEDEQKPDEDIEETEAESGEELPEETPEKGVKQQLIEDEMKTSYLDYSMSVIVSRALPDVRDGLKPVHRRILFAMQDMGMFHNKPYKKSARIVGEVLGKYHPHGDTAVYDSMVRMAQPFSLRYMLVDGQGNFGSIDGDRAAAMRYTEARLNRIAEEILVDIDKETVKFIPNFDDSLKEPQVLPSKFPNLLVNGSSGIAVGMATNIPPHNLGETIDAANALIDNPELESEELMEYIKGPDFPTGAIIRGTSGIRHAYRTGRGRILVKAKTTVEENKGKERIIITEIPYQVNKSMLIEEIANLVRDKTITGIADLRDESDKEGIRIVIDLKKDVNSDVLLNQLWKHSRLQQTYGVIMLALVNNEPKVLNLKQMLDKFIQHRKEVVTKRTEYEKKKAEERAHILEGLTKALDDVDNAIALIKKSKNAEEAKQGLISQYTLTPIQAQAILDMKLQRLTSLEQEKIREEHKNLLQLIEELKEILASEEKIYSIIKKENNEIKEKYNDERKTHIEEAEAEELEVEELIEPEDQVITITHKGYAKRLPIESYKVQRRGGKGVIAAAKREEDFVEDIFIANTHAYLLLFTNFGKVYWLKVHKLPEASRTAKGTALVNLVTLENGEKIQAILQVKEFDNKHYIVMATRNGTIKKTNLEAYSRPRQTGIIAITLEEGDKLISVKITDGNKQIMIATANGNANRFKETDVKSVGRAGKGVRGITLKENDEVIGMVLAEDDKTLLTVTENGYGKRTRMNDYRLINRGGKGVRNIICSERNGRVVEIKALTGEEQIMLISQHGIGIRIPASGISVIGRNTQGVRLMKLSEGDKVGAAAKIITEEEEVEEVVEE